MSQSRFEPPDEWPAQQRRVVRTDAPDWEERLLEAARRDRVAEGG